MIEFSPSKSRQYPEAETPENKGSDNFVEAKNSDWLFEFLTFIAVSTFLLALMIGLFQIVSFVIPSVGWFQNAAPAQDSSVLSTSFLPEGIPGGFLISAGILVMSGLFLAAARYRILHDPGMHSTAGCPSCQECSLVRVHRSRKDRLISAIGIPFGRYQCRDCHWNGLRVSPMQRPPSYVEGLVLKEMAAEAIDEPANSGPSVFLSQDSVEKTAVSENENSISGQPLDSGDFLLEKETNFTTQLSELISWKLPHAEDAVIEKQDPVQVQQEINESDFAKIVSPLSLNLRKDPQSDGEVIGTLEPGTLVKVLDSKKVVDGIAWREIRANDQDGWVLVSFLEFCE
jgi:hypothetical protein